MPMNPPASKPSTTAKPGIPATPPKTASPPAIPGKLTPYQPAAKPKPK